MCSKSTEFATVRVTRDYPNKYFNGERLANIGFVVIVIGL